MAGRRLWPSHRPTRRRPLAHELGRRDKLFPQFDLNHDGKVTQDEINKGLGEAIRRRIGREHRAHADCNSPICASTNVRKGSDKMFQQLDWNNDGRLSREEFLNAEHARFNRMDRHATG